MAGCTTRAIILRSVDYRESDRILTLFTETLGKTSAIAKGARSSRRRFGGALEPFALLEISLDPGRGKDRLMVLTEASVIEDNRALGTSLERVGAAAFLTELTREVVPQDEPDARMFEALETGLRLLASPTSVIRPLVLASQLRVLALAGFAVSTGNCNVCGKTLPGGRKAFFDPRRGGVICTGCGGGPILLEAPVADALSLLGRISPSDAAGLDLSTEILADIEHAVEIFVEEHLERQLKSNAFRVQIPPG